MRLSGDSVNYLFFADQIDQAPLLAQAAESGCVVIDLKGICSALSDVPRRGSYNQ